MSNILRVAAGTTTTDAGSSVAAGVRPQTAIPARQAQAVPGDGVYANPNQENRTTDLIWNVKTEKELKAVYDMWKKVVINY